MSHFSCLVLDRLCERDRNRLLSRAVPRSLARNDALFLAGQPSERVYVVVAGVMKLCGRSEQGAEAILLLATSGDLVGEVAAVDGGPQPLDAIALTRCQLVGFDSALFLKLLDLNPRAATELTRALGRRVRSTGETAVERATGPVAARLAGRLLDLATVLGRVHGTTLELDLPLAHRDLAGLAGTTRESTCRALKSLQRHGVVDCRGGRLRILRPETLRQIRCAGRVATPFR